MELVNIKLDEAKIAMEIIDMAKEHLKAQGIDQWQTGYPDLPCIEGDAKNSKGFFVKENNMILGYLCIDFDGEPAYDGLNGTWASNEKYVVVHRMAFDDETRGKSFASRVFQLVEDMAASRGINYFRVDTDGDNLKMQHILKKQGFVYRGTICFDNSEKIAFDKKF